MRIWDFPIEMMCMVHRSGQHREVHGIWGSIKKYYENGGKSGYSYHPETIRWIGREHLLWQIHQRTALTLKNHKSPLAKPCTSLVGDLSVVDSLFDQLENVRQKSESPNHKCRCDIDKLSRWCDSQIRSSSINALTAVLT